jgi:pilus assembly protein Flp/PilA
MRRFIQKAYIRRFLPAQEGATAIEYALIASGIAGAIIAAVNSLGGNVNVMWSSIANALN